MCDFSLKAVKSRPAKVGDKLTVHNFGYGTVGFCDPAAKEYEGVDEAVCVLPGSEIGFDNQISTGDGTWVMLTRRQRKYSVGIFRQINKETEHTHHDALELPDGETILLTKLEPGQRATVLQLPAAPKTEAEAKEQTRLEVVG